MFCTFFEIIKQGLKMNKIILLLTLISTIAATPPTDHNGVISILDFGATGNSTTDMSTPLNTPAQERSAIQTAINYALVHNFTLNFGNRVYEIDQALTIPATIPHKSLRIIGNGATIKLIAPAKGILIVEPSAKPELLEISGITFDGNFMNSSNKDGLIYVRETKGFSISKSVVQNSQGNCIRSFHQNSRIKITNNTIQACERNGIMLEGDMGLGNTTPAEQLPFESIITNNTVKNSHEQNGIFVSGGIGRFIIANNIVINSGDCGIEIGGSGSYHSDWRSKEVVISNNIVENSAIFDGTTSLDPSVPILNGASKIGNGAGILVRSSHDVHITDNIVNKSTGFGIHIWEQSNRLNLSAHIKDVERAALKIFNNASNIINAKIITSEMPENSKLAWIENTNNLRLTINDDSDGPREIYAVGTEESKLKNNLITGSVKHAPTINNGYGYFYTLHTENEGLVTNIKPGYIIAKSGWSTSTGITTEENGNFLTLSTTGAWKKLEVRADNFYQEFGRQQFILEIRYKADPSNSNNTPRYELFKNSTLLYADNLPITNPYSNVLRKPINFDGGPSDPHLTFKITPSITGGNSSLDIYSVRLLYPGNAGYLSLIENFNPAKP